MKESFALVWAVVRQIGINFLPITITFGALAYLLFSKDKPHKDDPRRPGTTKH